MSVARRREARLEIRLSATAKRALQQAAALQRKTISAFVLDSAVAAAAESLAVRRESPLSTKRYDAFVAALEAAPKRKPHLAKLLNSPHQTGNVTAVATKPYCLRLRVTQGFAKTGGPCAKSVIDSVRGEYPEFVFTRAGKPLTGMNSSGLVRLRDDAQRRDTKKL